MIDFRLSYSRLYIVGMRSCVLDEIISFARSKILKALGKRVCPEQNESLDLGFF